MGTGESLTALERVRRLQTALHAKAKESPGFRFYSLCDKVWRADVLNVAWQAVRRNGGAAGVDGQTVADIEAYGVERWLGELARELKAGTYRPNAVRQVLIPKKQRGKFRPLGIPCIRDRVAQTAAMLVLSPVFEADLQPEQYAYRPGRSAVDAVNQVHRVLCTGHREVVDADLTDYYGQIPHAELLKSVARRVSDGRMLGWVKGWLEMAVEEDNGKGGTRRTNRARRERKGTPQGSPAVAQQHPRRFILGCRPAFRRKSSYADDFVVLGKAPFGRGRDAGPSKLTVTLTRPDAAGCPRSVRFLGYRFGRNYRPKTGRAYIGTARQGERSEHMPHGERANGGAVRGNGPRGNERLNRAIWANYFAVGQVSPDRAIDQHTPGG